MATENDLDPIIELQRQQQEIEENLRHQSLKLEAEQRRLMEERRPFLELREKHKILAETIERVKTARPKILEKAAEWRQKVDLYLSESTLVNIDFSQMAAAWPDLARAEFLLPHIDRWLSEKSNDLAALDAELVALEKQHRSPAILKWLGKGRYHA
jgi:hypothetical protein